jgi:glycosyltransferase involved in cell wall biosynthesis
MNFKVPFLRVLKSILFLIFTANLQASLVEKKIVVIVASYNNELYFKKNLDSIFSQKYKNYHVIYIDDCSTDNTTDLVEKLVGYLKQQAKFKLIKNKFRQGALANHYQAIHMCDDSEIVVILDGDDWFHHDRVLERINYVYSKINVWLTYGQYIRYPTGELGHGKPIDEKLIKDDLIRSIFPFPFTSLRTFYAWLFKNIDKKDLLDKTGRFFFTAGDVAMMFPWRRWPKDT